MSQAWKLEARKLVGSPGDHREELQQTLDHRVAGRLQAGIRDIRDRVSTALDIVTPALLNEQKQPRLLSLQRTIRTRIMEIMHRTPLRPDEVHWSARQIPTMRRNLTSRGSLNSAYGLPNSSISPHALTFCGRSRTQPAYQQQREERCTTRRSNMLQASRYHKAQPQPVRKHRATSEKRVLKDLERLFIDRARADERRLTTVQPDRLPEL